MQHAPSSVAPFRQVDTLTSLFEFHDAVPGQDPCESPSYLGRGNFSTVFSALTREAAGATPAGAVVALKRVPMRDMDSGKAWRDMLREARILTRLQHPFVPRLVTAVYTKSELCLVMGRARGEPLTSLLRRRRRPLDEVEAAVITAQLLLALKHIHDDLGAVHRDVKPDNIVVAFGPPHEPVEVTSPVGPPARGPQFPAVDDHGSVRSWCSNKAAPATSPVLPAPLPEAHVSKSGDPDPDALEDSGPSNKARHDASSGSPDMEHPPSLRGVESENKSSLCHTEAARSEADPAEPPVAAVPAHLPQVTLVDFGFARLIAGRRAERHDAASPESTPFGSPVHVGPREFPAQVPDAAGATVVHTPCGSERFLAPELLLFIAEGGGHRMTSTPEALRKADVFAVGVVAHVMLGGSWPWSAKGKAALAHQMRLCGLKFSAPVWGDVSGDAKDFIAGLLHCDVSERFGVDRALRHAWLAKALHTIGAGPV